LVRASVIIMRFIVRHQIPVLIAALILGLVAAEVRLRYRPLPAYVTDFIYRQGADLPVHQPSKNLDLLAELKPNASHAFDDEGKPERTVTINSLGLRDPQREIPKPPGVFRIIMFGSSYTYGAEVNDAETVTTFMEKSLNGKEEQGRRYEVWNAGVSSFGPAQMTELARRLIAKGSDPDLILFHVSLLGPRGFLDGHIDLRAYQKDPSLLREHFILPFAENSKLWAFACSKSRLVLLLVAHYNRAVKKEDREKRLAKITTQRHSNALNRFAADFENIPMSSVECPCLDDHDMEVQNLMAKTAIPLDCIFAPKNAGAEYSLLHPPAHVYAEYADQWIALMMKQNLLPRP
jgi:hypothetical protein